MEEEAAFEAAYLVAEMAATATSATALAAEKGLVALEAKAEYQRFTLIYV